MANNQELDLAELSEPAARADYWAKHHDLLTLQAGAPHNDDAENAVLSVIFYTQGQILDEIQDKLGPYDFYQHVAQRTYQCAVQLHAEGIHVLLPTVFMELQRLHLVPTQRCVEYFSNLVRHAIFPGDINKYVKLVKDLSLSRQLITFCGRTIRELYQPGSTILEKIDRVGQVLGALARAGSVEEPAKDIKNLLPEVMKNLELARQHPRTLTGVPSGFRQLDGLLSGFQKTDLIILAARPGMGKTALALNMLLNASKKNIPVLFYSLEMSKAQLVQRLLSGEARVNLSYMRHASQMSELAWSEIYEAAERLNQLPFYIDDTPALTLLELKTRARLMCREKGIKLLAIDYLQLMRGSFQKNYSRELEIAEISRTLKALAKELDVPILALAQLNRKLEERGSKKPLLSDLRESGAIEQDADVVMFVYRADVYKDAKSPEVDNTAQIIVAKHRNGAPGVVELLYKSEYTTFHDLEEYDGPY